MKVLSVYYRGAIDGNPILVGKLAFHDRVAQFAYEPDFLTLGLELSPFALQPHVQLQQAKPTPFNGLHGLFADSLPDGWGMFLMDKTFVQNGISDEIINPIYRLAFIGDRAMGALSYAPDEGVKYQTNSTALLDISALANESVQLYTGEVENVLNELSIDGTPSGGARPKILLGVNGEQSISGASDLPEGYEHWLVKFPTGTSAEKKSEGAIEFVYSNLAKTSGIDFTATKLVAGKNDNAYFMTKRFDRTKGNGRVHIHTLAGLLYTDFRVADCEYETLFKLCYSLTKSHEEVAQLFKRMLFNIIAGNRDDHTKNFSFMMSGSGEWKNTPAYDLTFNKGINGWHSLGINGQGRDITFDCLRPLIKIASLKKTAVIQMIDEVCDSLICWEYDARQFNIPNTQILEIKKHINKQIKLISY